jgi:hypothetical protein
MADTCGGEATMTSNDASISAVNRVVGGKNVLVLRKNDADLLTVPNTPSGIVPKLQAVYVHDNQLALVVDFELRFQYQLFSLQNNMWTLQRSCAFKRIEAPGRDLLIQVQLTDLTHVTLTKNNGDADFNRQKGDVHPDDPKDIYQFNSDNILKNGAPYEYDGGTPE